MNTFEPICEFFYRHHEKILNETVKGLQLELRRQIQRTEPGLAIFVGAECVEEIYTSGERVGYVDYSINALQDLLHINMLKVSSEHRHRQIALCVLWRLWLTYQMPIVPLHFYPSTDPFWHRVRARFDAAGALDLSTVRYTDEELANWRAQQHKDNHGQQKMIRELKASPEWPQIQARFETWRDQ